MGYGKLQKGWHRFQIVENQEVFIKGKDNTWTLQHIKFKYKENIKSITLYDTKFWYNFEFFLNSDTGYEFANRFNSVKSNCSIMFTS